MELKMGILILNLKNNMKMNIKKCIDKNLI